MCNFLLLFELTMTRQSRTTTRNKTWITLRGETEWQDSQHQWRRDKQDHHSAHETQHLTSECARSLLVSFFFFSVLRRPLHSLHTTSWLKWLKLCPCLASSMHMHMHVVSVTLRLWALQSSQLPLLLILFRSPVLAALLPLPWGH